MGNLENFIRPRSRGEYFWAKEVPRFYSGINVWADSAIASLTDLNELSIKKKFNVTNLVLLSIIRKQGDKHDLIKHYLDFNNVNGRIKEKILYF